VNYVSYWDSSRFANWLHNGQPTGPQNASTTEDGAYLISGYKGYDGRTIQRKAGWKWAVTSEDEWYKAAYYKGGAPNAGYWDYPTQSDSVPSNVLVNPDPGNNANFSGTIGSPYYRTEVGEFENSESHYGTFDQGGNVSEWNEAIVSIDTSVRRGVRGGSYADYDTELRASSYRQSKNPVTTGYDLGFRVAEAVPEPSSLLILGSGILALAGAIRRRR
jgi:formylglycine-generating enzyme required for sulfatase activity